MHHLLSIEARAFSVALILIASISPAFSQQISAASIRSVDHNPRSESLRNSEPLGAGESARILAGFIAAETRVREALNQHTFKRDVVLQTIGPNGEVTGEYIRNSQFIFDDRGRRIERVLFHPASTIREMRITKEDIQDLEGSQLLGIDIVEATKYQLTYAGTEIVEARQLFAVDVTPLIQPDPSHMKNRFFVGRVWVDPTTLLIVKIKGIVEPQGKQRFPMFITWREAVKDALAFPTRTEADDILHFQGRDVHYRIKVRYYDYKVFASKVSITDLDEAPPTLEEASPKPKESPAKTQPQPRISAAPSELPLPLIRPLSKAQVCTTNRNAPPVGAYHWPADTEVKVYFFQNMFSPEQTAMILEAMKTWNSAGAENGSGVRFIYAGEADRLESCRRCLTVTRRDVFASDKHHYAFFNPMKMEEGRLLVAAWIDLDLGITEPKALLGFIAHEMGHGLGLWDCPSCKKKQSLMNSFPGLNKNNGLVGPSSCDLATMRNVYREERQIAAVDDVPRPEPVRSDSIFARPPFVVANANFSALELQRPVVGAATPQSSGNHRREGVRADSAVALMPLGTDKPMSSEPATPRPVMTREAASQSSANQRTEVAPANRSFSLPLRGTDNSSFSLFDLQRPHPYRYFFLRSASF